ncbi:MAG: hypothetical protein ACO1G9_05950 [Bacteroidota bacterium]
MSERKLTKVECHVYDLDAIKIFSAISKFKSNPNLSSSENENIDRFEKGFIRHLNFFSNDQNLDWQAHRRSNHPLIIPSTHNFYNIFLARTLVMYDPYKIKQFLNYQLKNFEGNYYAPEQKDFISLIEYNVYRSILNFAIDSSLALAQISHWIDEQRPFVVFRDPSTIVKLNSQHLTEIVNLLSSHFSKEDLININELFSGEPISGKITFNGDAIQLLDVFKKLKKSKILNYSYIQIENWVCNFFQYNSSGKILPITKSYAHEILAKNMKPCKNPLEGFESIPEKWVPKN